MHDLVDSLEKGDFYVRELAPCVGQDLDAVVIVFANFPAAAVIPVDLAIQDNGRGSRSKRLAGHLQFFRRNGLEIYARVNRGWPMPRNGQNQECSKASDEDYAT